MHELGFLIPIMGIIMGVSIPITAIKLRHKEKIEQMRLAASGNRDSGQAARQDAKIEQLQDRIAVLERIVTEGGYDLASQIEALRAHATQVVVGDGWFALSNDIVSRLPGREGYARMDPRSGSLAPSPGTARPGLLEADA